MAEKYLVDTNILIYAHDRSTGEKHHRARELVERLWATGQGVLSTQILQELCVNLQRKVTPPLSAAEISRLIQDYLSWEIMVNTGESIIQALEIQERYKTSFWDALVLQAAESASASILYSEDLTAGQKYGSIRVVNPLI